MDQKEGNQKVKRSICFGQVSVQKAATTLATTNSASSCDFGREPSPAKGMGLLLLNPLEACAFHLRRRAPCCTTDPKLGSSLIVNINSAQELVALSVCSSGRFPFCPLCCLSGNCAKNYNRCLTTSDPNMISPGQPRKNAHDNINLDSSRRPSKLCVSG